MKPVPEAKAAIMAAVFCWDGDAPFALGVEAGCLALSTGGFQCRNAVQILHGLPSGPRTMPGGSGGFLEDELDASPDVQSAEEKKGRGDGRD